MRTLTVRQIALASDAASTMPLAALAQQPDAGAPPPPQTEPLVEGEAPAITIRKPDQQNQTTEKRAPGGKVTEIKVISGGSTYYLKPNDQAGSAVVGDAQSNVNRPAQWQIGEFDLGQRREDQEAQTEQEAAAPPPPAPAPQQK